MTALGTRSRSRSRCPASSCVRARATTTTEERPTPSRLVYRLDEELDLDEARDLYLASTLGERRPVDDREVFAAMLRHANLVVTAREDGRLVGVARTLTDFLYVGYLADLAVRASHQRRGIGIELIARTRERMGPRSMLVLLAAPKAVGYYPRIGFRRHDSAWVLRANEPFPGRPAGGGENR